MSLHHASRLLTRLPVRHGLSATRRLLHASRTRFEAGSSLASKYEDKIRQRAEQEGVSISELKDKAKEQFLHQQKAQAEDVAGRVFAKKDETAKKAASAATSDHTRKDSSPVKPLSSILNLSKITSLKAGQISALWTAYHAAKSDGTGRGYLCAAVPLDLYNKMIGVAQKHRSFVLPVPRAPTAGASEIEQAEQPYEFYFMEWGFHEPPPAPATMEDPFKVPTPSSSLPSVATVLFTPLQEYKLRTAFATPYLVLTHYTDLVDSHGIVLLRGEITPSPSGEGRFMLSQEDAQLLSMGLQKFYLWDDQGAGSAQGRERQQLLQAFHSSPDTFEWEQLLKHAQPV